MVVWMVATEPSAERRTRPTPAELGEGGGDLVGGVGGHASTLHVD
jgi:hypothetical protein